MVVDETGDTVARESVNNEDFTSNCEGYNQVSWEQALTLDYNNEFNSQWPPGTYRATITVDDFYSAAVDVESMSFEVVEE